MKLVRPDLLQSTQRALLGTIGNAVLAVCVNEKDGDIEVTVFTSGSFTDDQPEALEMAGSEIAADFPSVSMDVRFTENTQQSFRAEGAWVFLRLGCLVS